MRCEERMARMQYLPSLSQSLSSSKWPVNGSQFLYNLSGLKQLKPFLQPSPHASPLSAHLATQFMTHASEINGATFFFILWLLSKLRNFSMHHPSMYMINTFYVYHGSLYKATNTKHYNSNNIVQSNQL